MGKSEWIHVSFGSQKYLRTGASHLALGLVLMGAGTGGGTELLRAMLTANLTSCRAGVTLPLHSTGVAWSPSPKTFSTKNRDCFT